MKTPTTLKLPLSSSGESCLLWDETILIQGINTHHKKKKKKGFAVGFGPLIFF